MHLLLNSNQKTRSRKLANGFYVFNFVFLNSITSQKCLHSRNLSYAPYLPSDDNRSGDIGRMLDKKYSLEPVKNALEISEKNSMSNEELPSGIVRKISVRLFHSRMLGLFKHPPYCRKSSF